MKLDELIAELRSSHLHMYDGSRDGHGMKVFRLCSEAADAIEGLRDALVPFAGDKMPALRRTLLDYDRYGLRRIISPMEIAMLRARQALDKQP